MSIKNSHTNNGASTYLYKRGLQSKSRCRKDSDMSNDSGLVSRQGSNVSSYTIPDGVHSPRERHESEQSILSDDSGIDSNGRQRSSEHANSVPQQTTDLPSVNDANADLNGNKLSVSQTHDDKNRRTVSSRDNVCVTETGLNGNDNSQTATYSREDNTNIVKSPSYSKKIDTHERNGLICPALAVNPSSDNTDCFALNVVHEEAYGPKDVCNDFLHTEEFYHDPNNNDFENPLLAQKCVGQNPYRLPSSTKAGQFSHRKSNSYSYDLASVAVNDLAEECAKRRRYKSEGNGESVQLIESSDKHDFNDKFSSDTCSSTNCCNASVSACTIKHDTSKQAWPKTAIGCELKQNNSEDIQSVKTLETNKTVCTESANATDYNGSDACSISELELDRTSNLSVQLSQAFSNARQDIHTSHTGINLTVDDPDDHAIDSLKVNIDKHYIFDNEEEEGEEADTCKISQVINMFQANDKHLDDERDNCRCCGAWSRKYTELVNRIDILTNDYQWQNKRLEDTISSTRGLKTRVTKVAATTLSITFSLVCISAVIVVIRDIAGSSSWHDKIFSGNITTRIADLQEQYVSVSDMVNDLMTRSKSIIHLTNGGKMSKHDGSYFVRWMANENHGQGSLALSETKDSIVAPTGGYYRICAKIHYKANLENVTSIKLEYNLVQSTGGYHEPVRNAVREFPSTSGSLQYELQLDTTLYVYPQDAILVSVRPDQIQYLADFDSAHEFTMLEVG